MNITLSDKDAIQKLYDKAVEENQESFMYKGHEILTAYAKYLLEYLNSVA